VHQTTKYATYTMEGKYNTHCFILLIRKDNVAHSLERG
jgi:hypothetical protein